MFHLILPNNFQVDNTRKKKTEAEHNLQNTKTELQKAKTIPLHYQKILNCDTF